MSVPAIDFWLGCLRDLRRLTSSSSSTRNSTSTTSNSSNSRCPPDASLPKKISQHILQEIERVGPDAMTVSVATHARLVEDLKLPLHLCSACNTAAEWRGAPEDQASVITAAFRALTAYTKYFSVSKGEAAAAAGEDQAAVARLDPLNHLLDTLRSQVQESGLLQHLPKLMTDTAHALQQDAQSTDQQQPGTSIYSELLQFQACALADFSQVLAQWNTGRPFLSVAAASTPAAFEMADACMAATSKYVQKHGKPGTVYGVNASASFNHMHRMVVTFLQAASVAGGLTQNLPSMPGLKAVLQSPLYMPAIVRTITMMAFGMLAEQHEAAAGASRSRGGGRSRQHSRAGRPPSALDHATVDRHRVRQNYLTTWAIAQCMLRQHVTAQQQRLFGLMGIDSTTMMWAAAASRAVIPPFVMAHLLTAYKDCCAYWQEVVVLQQPAAIAACPGEAELHLLLPSVVLCTAAQTPTADDQYEPACLYAAGIAAMAMRRVTFIQEQQQRVALDAHDIPQEMVSVFVHRLSISTNPSLAALRQACQPTAAVTAELMAEVLPAFLSMLAHVQQALEGSAAAAAAAASAAAAAAAGGGGAAGSSLVVALQGLYPAEGNQRQTLSNLTSALSYMLMSYTRGAQTAAAASNSSVGQAGGSLAAAAADADAAIRRELTPILKRMEGVVRITAGAPACLNAASQEHLEALVALSCALDMAHCGFVRLVIDAGLGSIALEQLYSLLSSMLKASVVFARAHKRATVSVMHAAARAAATALACYSSSTAVSGGRVRGREKRAAVSQAASSAGGGGVGAVSLLPSLVTVGRCCLLWQHQLKHADPGVMAAELRRASAGMHEREQCLFIRAHPRSKQLIGPLEAAPAACAEWLARADVQAQLQAAGYRPEMLQQMQQAAAEFQEALAPLRSGSAEAQQQDGAAAVLAFVPKVLALGEALTLPAIPEACNNPACRNLTGLKEKSLVSGKGSLCSECRVAHYCCKECSVAHWKQHKPVCKALSSARATAN